MSPREAIQRLEESASLPPGSEERFNGYGVMGLTFASGHILAMRRFPASSIGPAYTSLWHRSPRGEWTFYSDVAPRESCARYFGKTAVAAVQTPIHLSWTAPRRLDISAPDVGLSWWLEVHATPATFILNGVAALLPDATWRNARVLRMIASVAGTLFRLGHVGLSGSVPNGQHFLATPKRLWVVSDSRAALKSEDFGTPAPLNVQARLGDFWIPQRGILALGQGFFDPFDAHRHSADSCGLAHESEN
jgi:hypothetical protein